MMTLAQKKRLKELRKKQEENRTKYYHTDEIKKTGANYFFIMGLRSNGKSYAIKYEVALKDALDNRDKPEGVEKKRFMYVRRHTKDVAAFQVLQWLNDMVQIPKGETESPLMKLSEGQFNDFIADKRKIFAIYRNEDGEIIERYKIGYWTSLIDATSIKSQNFDDVSNIILEEAITRDEPYLTNEPILFDSVVTTVARRRRDVRVWLVANTDSRECPYYRHYGLDRVKNQKSGEIDVYEKVRYVDGEKDVIKFAVEYCENIVKENEGIYFGKTLKSNSGDWTATDQPTMTQQEADELDCIYEMFVIYHDLKYYCKLLMNKDETGYFWYVRPWNKMTLKPDVRIVTDDLNQSAVNPMITANFEPLFPAEKKFFDLIENQKVTFCDDLCGTEFRRACQALFNNKIYNREV